MGEACIPCHWQQTCVCRSMQGAAGGSAAQDQALIACLCTSCCWPRLGFGDGTIPNNCRGSLVASLSTMQAGGTPP